MMRLPRPRLRLRTCLVLIAVAAAGLGAARAYRDYEARWYRTEFIEFTIRDWLRNWVRPFSLEAIGGRPAYDPAEAQTRSMFRELLSEHPDPDDLFRRLRAEYDRREW